MRQGVAKLSLVLSGSNDCLTVKAAVLPWFQFQLRIQYVWLEELGSEVCATGDGLHLRVLGPPLPGCSCSVE